MRIAISSLLALDLQLFFNFSDGQMSDLEISPPPRNKRNSMPRKSNENLQSSSHDKIVKRQQVNSNYEDSNTNYRLNSLHREGANGL